MNTTCFVHSEFELIQKPEWLDKFKEKYDEPFPYHITYKYPCDARDEDIPKINNLIKNVASKYAPVELKFDNLEYSETSKGKYILVRATQDHNLTKLQKEILKGVNPLVETKEYFLPYEKNFRPHVTIARRLPIEKFKQAKKEIKSPIICITDIDSITLGIRSEQEEEQKYHYKLTG